MHYVNHVTRLGKAVLRGAGAMMAAAAAISACAVPPASSSGSEDPGTLSAALDDTYTQTKYPIVLCHGLSGFTSLFGVVDYFYEIESALTAGGATVFVTHVPAFDTNEARGEELLGEVEDIVARTGAAKVNLIGHSQGGLDVRYVAAMRPDLVASVTTVGSPHQGATLADFLLANLTSGGFTETVLALFADDLGTLLALISGYSDPQDAIGALNSLSSQGAAAYNAKFPAGLPTTPCGSGPASVNGIQLYSWAGDAQLTNLLDVSDGPLKLSSLVYKGGNDGLVGQCSAHFGTVLRDDYEMNHLDEVNQILGLTAIFATNPVSVFRTHANRLKLAGL
jgi:triacylglycerol lipase